MTFWEASGCLPWSDKEKKLTCLWSDRIPGRYQANIMPSMLINNNAWCWGCNSIQRGILPSYSGFVLNWCLCPWPWNFGQHVRIMHSIPLQFYCQQMISGLSCMLSSTSWSYETHPQGWLKLDPAPMLEQPGASRADPLASHQHWVSAHLAYFRIGL